MNEFLNSNYQTPAWLSNRISRRKFLKASAVTGVAASLSLPVSAQQTMPSALTVKQPWVTFDAVQQHLLPSSDSGPGATEIQALNYLYNLLNEQSISKEEVEFIHKGVGWLNSYTDENYSKSFTELDFSTKEIALRDIGRSRAGENWLSTLLNYIFEAMLAPPAYGGNPDNVGWQWLEHQPGFPLPKTGNRYYELPGQVKNKEQAINVSVLERSASKGKLA